MRQVNRITILPCSQSPTIASAVIAVKGGNDDEKVAGPRQIDFYLNVGLQFG
jgi:hypothetical protein